MVSVTKATEVICWNYSWEKNPRKIPFKTQSKNSWVGLRRRHPRMFVPCFLISYNHNVWIINLQRQKIFPSTRFNWLKNVVGSAELLFVCWQRKFTFLFLNSSFKKRHFFSNPPYILWHDFWFHQYIMVGTSLAIIDIELQIMLYISN